MLSIMMLAALIMLGDPQVDSVGVYSVILSDVRAEHRGVPVVLAETRTGVECMPHCGAIIHGKEQSTSGEAAVHGARVTQALRDRGLIEASCTVRPRVFGCLGHPRHIFVALGEISSSPRNGPPEVKGAYWVQVALLVPCRVRCGKAKAGGGSPDGFGYWVLVRQQSDGSWRTGRRQPTFAL